MSSVLAVENPNETRVSSRLADALASRLEQGARELGRFARTLSDSEWRSRVPHDGRKIGVVVHHVASQYGIEIGLARTVASGEPVTGLSWDDVHKINADHARDHDGATKDETLELLARNSAEAAAAIRALSDEDLRRAVPISLYGDAPLTCQFALEDHAVRHAFHHLAKIRAALGR